MYVIMDDELTQWTQKIDPSTLIFVLSQIFCDDASADNTPASADNTSASADNTLPTGIIRICSLESAHSECAIEVCEEFRSWECLDLWMKIWCWIWADFSW